VAAPGDMFFTLGTDGKKKGLIKVEKIKGDKAIGKLGKGKAEVGMALQRKSGSATASGSGSTGSGSTGSGSSASGTTPGSARSYFGVMAGYTRDSMKTKVNDKDSSSPTVIGEAAMTGSGFSLKGLFDYELFKQVWFRGTVGIEQFNVAGSFQRTATSTNNIPNCDSCTTSIMYLAFDFVGRYVFSEGKFRPWLGFGISMLMPVTKSTTALAAESIGTTNVMIPQAGFDFHISPRSYIPVSLEYGLLPKSDTVPEANWIGIRSGFAMTF
jgi:hypothetical protein